MQRIKAKLTKRSVDAFDPPNDGAYIVSDTEDDGLRLRVFASGKKKFAVEYRIGNRVRWHTFGTYGPMTVEQARTRYKKLWRGVERGEDPTEIKLSERAQPTFAEYAARWVERSRAWKKPASLRNDELLLRLHLTPAFGWQKLRAIRKTDLSRLHGALAHKKTTANRAMALASTIFNAAEEDEERDRNSNPAAGVVHFKERRIERALTPDEVGRLWAVLDSSTEAPAAVAGIRFLLLTGLRCGEALALRWADIEVMGARLQLRDSKTGARRVLLSAPAVEFLQTLPRTSEFVFPGKAGHPLADLTHPWQRTRKLAGLEGIRLHDLRHHFASVAISAGLSLEHLAPLMGHTNVATTRRYAHLLEDAERRATDTVGAAMALAIAPLAPTTKTRPGLTLVKR